MFLKIKGAETAQYELEIYTELRNQVYTITSNSQRLTLISRV